MSTFGVTPKDCSVLVTISDRESLLIVEYELQRERDSRLFFTFQVNSRSSNVYLVSMKNV